MQEIQFILDGATMEQAERIYDDLYAELEEKAKALGIDVFGVILWEADDGEETTG